MPEDLMHATDEAGHLKFLSGSIAIHILSRDFVNRMGGGDSSAPSLPFHRANKIIPTINADGNPVKPESPNGVKFEMFVFDALPVSEKTVVIETQRSSDFSPVKNAEGLDSPKTCKKDQMKEFVSWLQAAGTGIATDDDGVPLQPIEVSPIFGYDVHSFASSWNALSEKPDLAQPLDLK
jgi:UDP-N-acetylglucosamine/UDP-N-acetylgalactosamine diphosphorylase